MLVIGNGLLGSAFNDAIVLTSNQCNITSRESIVNNLDQYKPAVVVNCAGIVPKNTAGLFTMFKVNSLAPHILETECMRRGIKLIHISTNCVFGIGGPFYEYSETKPTDMYGLSKILGEPKKSPRTLILRTSFVGLPDPKGRGLLAWASKQARIIGYDQVKWNGVTTKELVNQIKYLTNKDICGIKHIVSYETINKYELLKLAKEVFDFDYELIKESTTNKKVRVEDRTLLADTYINKSIVQQLEELC